LEGAVAAMNRAQRRGLEVPFVGVAPGDEVSMKGDLVARAFRTHHTVPSLGYELFRRVPKLREEFRELPPAELRRRRELGDDLFDVVERSELTYATDTLIDVLDDNPRLYSSRVLVLECTFLDERKGRGECREKGHVHLEEILARAELFKNQHLVLMHFSQLYQPAEVSQILKSRLPPDLARITHVFAPTSGPWPG
jgi:ribonuclease Z